MFNDLTTEGLEKNEDRLGGGYSAYETGAYTGTIKMAYGSKSQGGAKAVNLIVELDGKEYRETLYVTNRNGQNFYMAKDKDKKETGKKNSLPGFTVVNDICLVTTGKELFQQDVQEKVVKIYDYDAKAELPKTVPVLVDLIGKEITLAIQKSTENKKEKKGDDYVEIAETRDVNNIEKVFDTETKLTVPEAQEAAEKDEVPVAAFYPAWVERNKGVTKDKRKIKDGSAGQSAGAPKAGAAAASTAPRQSLFGANKG